MADSLAAGATWLYENPEPVVLLIFLGVAILGWFVRRVVSRSAPS